MQREPKAANDLPASTLHHAEVIPWFIYIKFHHQANTHAKYDGGFHNSIIDDKDGHIPSPLIMFTCTALRHALLEWQWNKGVHPKASKPNLKVDRPDRSIYFNVQNDGGKNASCWAATGCMLLTSPSVADMYTVLMNSWITLPESYQQRVFKNTLTTVQCLIQQGENPTPAMVISVEAARVGNAIPLDYFTSTLALEEPEIGSIDPNIPIDNNCTDDELHFRMPGGSGEYLDDGDKRDDCDAIPTARLRRWAATDLERFNLGTCDVSGYEGEHGNDAYADVVEEASQADDGSMQNVEDWGHNRFDLGTSDVDGYEGEDGENMDVAEEDKAL